MSICPPTRPLASSLVLSAVACFAAASFAADPRKEAQKSPPPPLLLTKPTLSQSHVAFVHARDLWIVPRPGGEARRLTTGVGVETDPFFSPDGKLIAFTGEYDGNVDVYTVPATGGVPQRLTWHPGTDTVAGWSPDGKSILFRSGRASYNRFNRLFTLPLDGGFPSELPLAMAEEGCFSPDGRRMAYLPIARAFQSWKRYAGGRTTKIWLADLSDSRIEKIPRDNSNDFNPMWAGDKVYFLSDRSGPVTLFSYDTKTKKVKQEMANAGLDVKSASLGPGAIAFEQFGALNLFDLRSAKAKRLDVALAGDLPELRARFEKVGTRISGSAISPTGARAVFEARGDIFTVPSEKGDVRNLTATPGAAERDPAWSPDGRWIAFFSDESGEYALHLREQSGRGEVRKIPLPEPSFYYSPVWSPDSKKIAFSDKRLNLWTLDIETRAAKKVDTNLFNFGGSGFSPVWSADSRWLAYNKQLPTMMRAIFVHSLADATSRQVTDGMSDARTPAWDRTGRYLYFTASTDIGPSIQGFEMTSYTRQSTRSIYLAVLRKDLPSPFLPESDEEKVEEKKDDAKPADAKPAEPAADAGKDGAKKAAPRPPAEVKIDFDNISQRILALPLPARNYLNLIAGRTNQVFILERPERGGGGRGAAAEPAGLTLSKYDVARRKLDPVATGLGAFELSANLEKALIRVGERWAIASAGAGPMKTDEGTLRTADMELRIEPQAEWTQMFREVWRIERDFFYAPNHHGLDLKATEKQYEPWLAGLSCRDDLNYLFQEMLGELSVGHLYVQGGDRPDAKRVRGGLLGADFKIENGRYRFERVYNGESWNPQLRAPLTQPGVNVVAGEYLLAVNGRNVAAPQDNVYRLFEATSGRSVLLRVGPNADGAGSREVTVVPVDDETSLRTLAWVEDNRRKVDAMSGGRLAYIHLPDTATGGFTFFNRYYFAQVNKDGAVIDERFNRGGQAATYIIDYLKQDLLNYWATRDGMDMPTPVGALRGPKAMLVNEYAGSGGDLMPWYFRKQGIGPLIGQRTWGGLVGIGGYPTLVDGGTVTAPHFAFWNPDGKWEIENFGVAPDIEVEFDPAAVRAGKDPQLEKAVEVLLEKLKQNPPVKHQRPPYPDYHKPPVKTSVPAGGGR